MTLPSLVSGTVCCSVVYEHSSFPYHGKVGATSIDSQYLHCQKCLGSQKELRTPGPVSCNQTLCLAQDIKPMGSTYLGDCGASNMKEPASPLFKLLVS